MVVTTKDLAVEKQLRTNEGTIEFKLVFINFLISMYLLLVEF